jgi:hypothetical protein
LRGDASRDLACCFLARWAAFFRLPYSVVLCLSRSNSFICLDVRVKSLALQEFVWSLGTRPIARRGIAHGGNEALSSSNTRDLRAAVPVAVARFHGRAIPTGALRPLASRERITRSANSSDRASFPPDVRALAESSSPPRTTGQRPSCSGRR